MSYVKAFFIQKIENLAITTKRCTINSPVSRYCGKKKLLLILHVATYSLFMGTKYKKKLLLISHRVLYSLFMGTKYINIFPRGILFPIT